MNWLFVFLLHILKTVLTDCFLWELNTWSVLNVLSQFIVFQTRKSFPKYFTKLSVSIELVYFLWSTIVKLCPFFVFFKLPNIFSSYPSNRASISCLEIIYIWSSGDTEFKPHWRLYHILSFISQDPHGATLTKTTDLSDRALCLVKGRKKSVHVYYF